MEKEILTSAIVQEFLEDFEKNSITELLEEGKEQNEIFQIAEARGIKLKDRQCLAGFKTVYTFANKAFTAERLGLTLSVDMALFPFR